MSPLQYQKAIRLHEARRLMLFQRLDATGAAGKVGYVGGPPAKDTARLRDEGLSPPRSA